MGKRIIRTIVAATLVVSLATALSSCITSNPPMRSDTGYGSKTIPADHNEEVRQKEREEKNTTKRIEETPEERRSLVEHYKEVLRDI